MCLSSSIFNFETALIQFYDAPKCVYPRAISGFKLIKLKNKTKQKRNRLQIVIFCDIIKDILGNFTLFGVYSSWR